ncbi:MAG: hypothetical protein VCC00_14825 [Deltaproteobacteria bacterium]
MNKLNEIRRPNTANKAPRRLIAVGRRVKDGWLIRTDLNRFQAANVEASKNNTAAA